MLVIISCTSPTQFIIVRTPRIYSVSFWPGSAAAGEIAFFFSFFSFKSLSAAGVLHTLNQIVMNYYLIKKQTGELSIMTVKEADEPSFQEDYGAEILLSGSSIQAILIAYGELLNASTGE